jgi:hypothetical protein
MQNERDVFGTTFYERAIRIKIGDALSAGYDLSQPLTDKIRKLLVQIDEPGADEVIGDERRSPTPNSLE